MSFVGDLEHLPIVDVIQLLHSTRKSGTLCLKSQKGQSQLVFDDGYIVSANHVNTSVRIGQILVEMDAISEDELENALKEQEEEAGGKRAPLIALLIKSGRIDKKAAYQGLETLIHMTIVEVLTWSKGTFELDVNTKIVSDEYKYFPEELSEEINLDTQGVLMDALRIYDEKMRDGTLTDEEGFGADLFSIEKPSVAEVDKGGFEISEDILGLSDMDVLERKTPAVFSGVNAYDPAEMHRIKVKEALDDIPINEQGRLLAYINEYQETKSSSSHPIPLAVILFSKDELIKQSISMICSQEGYYIFTTDEEITLDHILLQSLSKGLIPLLIIDMPEGSEGDFSETAIINLLQQKLLKYPRIAIIQFISANDFKFSLQALKTGARTVIPKPCKEDHRDTFIDDMITFLEVFRSYTKKSFSSPEQLLLSQFKKFFFEISTLKEAPEITFALLRAASLMFERAITFVVGRSELIADRAIGVNDDKSTGITPPLRFKIPLTQPSVFQDVIEYGCLFYGQSNDHLLKTSLFSEIGPPQSSNILLVPIKCMGKVIALTYGDFGRESSSQVQTDLLEILAHHAGRVLENSLYRKKFEKPLQTK